MKYTLDFEKISIEDAVKSIDRVSHPEMVKDWTSFRAPVRDEGLPDNGGDDRFDVYLVAFAGQGDGNYRDDVCSKDDPQICAGYMVQENDFKGYGYPSTLVANRILANAAARQRINQCLALITPRMAKSRRAVSAIMNCSNGLPPVSWCSCTKLGRSFSTAY